MIDLLATLLVVLTGATLLALAIAALIIWTQAVGDLPWLLCLAPRMSLAVAATLGILLFTVGLSWWGPATGAAATAFWTPILLVPAVNRLSALAAKRPWPKAGAQWRNAVFDACRQKLKDSYTAPIVAQVED